MIWGLVLLAVIIILFCFWLEYMCKDEKLDKIPGPKGVFLIGNGLDFLAESATLFRYFRKLTKEYKDLFKLKMLKLKAVVIYNPEDVETVLTNTEHNDKGYLYSFLRPWLNDGLLISNGAKWHQRRKILTPAFHFNILRHFSTILVEKSENLAESLRPETDKPKTDIYPFITNMTLNTICETAMGTAIDNEASDFANNYKDAIHVLGTYLLYRTQRVWLHPMSVFNLSSVGRNQKKLLNEISSFRDHVIEQRRENGNYKDLYSEVMNEQENDFQLGKKKRLAMLDLLLEKEEQGIIDIEGINEEVDTFMFEDSTNIVPNSSRALSLLSDVPRTQIVCEKLAEPTDVFQSFEHTRRGRVTSISKAQKPLQHHTQDYSLNINADNENISNLNVQLLLQDGATVNGNEMVQLQLDDRSFLG